MCWNYMASIPRDGNIVILHTAHGVVSTWFDCETSEWVCFDDSQDVVLCVVIRD